MKNIPLRDTDYISPGDLIEKPGDIGKTNGSCAIIVSAADCFAIEHYCWASAGCAGITKPNRYLSDLIIEDSDLLSKGDSSL